MAKKSKKAKVISRKSISKAKSQKQKGDKQLNKCIRCNKDFPSRASLKVHLKTHAQALQEIKMLEQGFVPIESKIGLEFKGKNRIIIS